MKKTGWRVTLLGIAVWFGAATPGHAKAEITDPGAAVFATVNGDPILQSSYVNALRVAGRQRFYHGNPPEAELVEFRKEVAERLVVERVMYQEAVRRNLTPDQAWVDAEFDKIEKRYSKSPEWHSSGETLHRQIREGLEQKSLIEQVDESYRSVEQPNEDAVRSYYEKHADKFTSPEQIRVSTILFKVEPWEPHDAWEARKLEAKQVLDELHKGADFAAIAAEYPPTDQTQLGYIHRGMLGEAAQIAIDKLKPGEITDLVTLLEGVAIFRLDERIPAQLNAFEKVRERATALLSRELSEQRYEERMKALRQSAKVEFADPNYYQLSNVGSLQDGLHRAPTAVKNE